MKKQRMGLRWGFEIQRYRIASEEEARDILQRDELPEGARMVAGDLVIPNRPLVAGKNEVMDDAQEELLKIWRYISGSSRTIKTMSLGSGFTDPTRSDTDMTTSLDEKDIEEWDDTLITPDSLNESLVKASCLWLSTEANGTISEIGLKFDNDDLVTHALFSKLSITGATKANPVVITTSSNHDLSTGDEVHIDNCGGMTEINNRNFTITVVDADEFSLDGENGTGHTTYTTGGNAWLIVVKSSGEVVETRYVLTLSS